jgi:hypothetical protein
MASLYKRGDRYWIGYYRDGEHVNQSLHTTSLKVAREEKRKIEYELAIGDLQPNSKLPLPKILAAFCRAVREDILDFSARVVDTQAACTLG